MATIKSGESGSTAKVNSENMLLTRAVVMPEIQHAAHDHGESFSFDSGERDIDAGDTMLFVKNTSNVDLFLSEVILNGSNVICSWSVLIGNASTTPVAGGGTVTGVNMNRNFAAKTADVTAIWDETAVADGDVVKRVWTAVTESKTLDLRGIIVGPGHYVQINQITESTQGSAILIVHFDQV